MKETNHKYLFVIMNKVIDNDNVKKIIKKECDKKQVKFEFLNEKTILFNSINFVDLYLIISEVINNNKKIQGKIVEVDTINDFNHNRISLINK